METIWASLKSLMNTESQMLPILQTIMQVLAYLKQGKFELARLYLEDFSSSDLLIQARAYSLVGDTLYGRDRSMMMLPSIITRQPIINPTNIFLLLI